MNEDFTKRRLQDIEDNIRQDLEMLKGYEDELRFATDHRIIAKCQQDIKRQREFLAKYSKEYLNFTCREANLSKPEEDEKHKSEFIFNINIHNLSWKRFYDYKKIFADKIKEVDLSWEDFCTSIKILSAELNQLPPEGGFIPDIVFGISHGGITVADLIFRGMGDRRTPVLSLWADRQINQPECSFSKNKIESLIKEILGQRYNNNILIFDDISRTGSTLLKAKKFLKEELKEIKNLRIKTATLVILKETDPEPDYWIIKTLKSNFLLPCHILS